MKSVDDVVRETVEGFVSAGDLFTALDVSNKVKETLPSVRHRDARDLVRASFQTEIEPAGYARTPITVTLSDGSTAEALLYHPLSDSWDLDAKYDSQQRAKSASRSVQPAAGLAVSGVGTSTTSVFVAPATIPAPPVVTAPATIPAPAGNARGLWDAMFKSQPSLFPLK